MAGVTSGVRETLFSKKLSATARSLTLGAVLAAICALSGQQAAAESLHHSHHAVTRHIYNHVMRSSYRHPESRGYKHAYGERHGHLAREVEFREPYGEVYHYGHSPYRRHSRYASYRSHYSGLQCVPYAREVSHIDLSGNAFLWWAEAAGRYARGNTPEEGAVLNFRAIGRMPLGHVAVVTSVIDSRTILVTQANWVRGAITNDVTMQDVSPNNDWSQVEVELGDSSTWGAAYPTYGFIYNRPAVSTIIAANAQGNEVAEAPPAPAVVLDAPDRNLQ